jgi:hypothetical protein
MSRTTCYLLAVLLGTIGVVGCGGDRNPVDGWSEIDAHQLTQVQTRQKHEADSAKEALFANLATTLQSYIKRDGLEAAIGVCRAEAPRLAKQISDDRKLKIGRTSFRLRNPENAPPAWAAPYIDRREETPRYLAGPEGALGALLPIRLVPKCLKCHGSREKVAEPVRRKIEETYPRDRAMGFSANDLRGWFWVEVPKRG